MTVQTVPRQALPVNEAGTRDSGTEHSSQTQARIEDALFDAASAFPDDIAIVDGQRYVSYRELAALVVTFARVLTDAGVRADDRVAVYLDKSLAAVVALYAVWSVGAVAVQANSGLRSRQVGHILQHSGAKVLLSSSRLHARLDDQALQQSQFIDIAAALAEMDGNDDTVRLPQATSKRAAILYTSGSTGLPKGIVLSHENLIAGARIVSRYLHIGKDERIISIVPFNFDYGLNQLLTSVLNGATLVLQRSTMAADVCRTLLKERITAMAGVPPFWIHLMSPRSPFATLQFPHLRYITNTGGAFPVDLVQRYREHLPDTRIYLMYGLSEAFRSTYLPPEDLQRFPDSMGKAIPECDVFAVNAQGQRCAVGEVGELVHRGPTVALEYWNDAETTQRVFRPDPFPAEAAAGEKVVYSGDLVRQNEEGYFFFVGRRDETIKSLGYRISPGEVEALAHASGFVSDVVVKGEADPELGAALVVHCVPRSPAHFESEQLLAYFRQQAPRYMLPRKVVIHEQFPYTCTGKINRAGVGA